ncbi:50S ribosomal protein L35 [Streptococcus agalactiae]|nr:50S ribosomal protein L35 [Streptococcus agalactiae]AUO98793.1 50S ribosomal protein L35 [Streptococcus agalactiae]
MPKQKTHRASAKRFKRTGSGGLKRFRAFTSHRFHGKTKKHVVIFVKLLWFHQEISNVLKQCLLALNNKVSVNIYYIL